jgi:mannose-6-phosphate isomerase
MGSVHHLVQRQPQRSFAMIRVVEKKWGSETWLALTKDYCFKRIVLLAGCKTSLQFHNQKEETNHIASGRGLYWYEDETGKLASKEISAGFTVHIPPGTVHRFEAIDDIVLFEASTIHVEDVVRLQDDYGREGTSTP